MYISPTAFHTAFGVEASFTYTPPPPWSPTVSVADQTGDWATAGAAENSHSAPSTSARAGRRARRRHGDAAGREPAGAAPWPPVSPVRRVRCERGLRARPRGAAAGSGGPASRRAHLMSPGCRAAGPPGRRAAGPPGRRAAGPPGRRAAGPPGRRAAGPPGRRAAGPPGRRAGPPGRRAIMRNFRECQGHFEPPVLSVAGGRAGAQSRALVAIPKSRMPYHIHPYFVCYQCALII